MLPIDHYLEDPYAIRTQPDGSCFPHAVSRLVYGNQDHTAEMRVKLIYEMVRNINHLTDNQYLEMGLSEDVVRSLARQETTLSFQLLQ